MIRLLKYELFKIWKNRLFLISFALLIVANLFLLWFKNVHAPGSISPAAYKTLALATQEKDTIELGEFLHAEFSRAEALLYIDSVLGQEAVEGKTNTNLREKYAPEFEAYYETYQSKDYLVYGENLLQEYTFLKSIVLEFNQVSDYDGFLDDIEDRAKRLSSISIFANSERGYEKENLLVTAQAFKGMRGTEIQYFPQKGIVTALNFELTDAVAVLSMLLVATVSVRMERDDGLLGLVRANPAGRFRTAVAKFFAFSVSLGFILVCFYGLNLLYCEWLYGLGPLSRTIQSVPLLVSSTLRLTVGQYIGYFLFTKWLAALICGTWVMFAMLTARNLFWGVLSSLGLIILNLVVRTIVPATSNLNVLKYANLVSLLRTNELLGRYHNLYWFDSPIMLVVVESLFATGCFIVFVTLFLLTFSKKYFSAHSRSIKSISLPKTFEWHHASVTGTEWYKLLVLQGGAVVLVLLIAFQIYTATNTESYINAEEIYYRNYIKPIEGKWTADKYDWMTAQAEEFTPIYQLNYALAAKIITEQEYQVRTLAYSSLFNKMSIYQQVVDKINTLKENPNKQLVYESGWLKILDYQDIQDLNDSLLISIVCALCFSSFFAMEYQTGMIKIITATSLGRENTVREKTRIAIIVCGALAALSLLPRFWIVLRDYGLGAWMAPLYSIEQYSAAPGIPLFLILFILFMERFAAVLCMSFIILVFSQRTRNAFAALFLSLFVFTLPLGLSMLGLDKIKWVSLYFPFHLCNLLGTTGGAFLLIASAITNFCVCFICFHYLTDHF